MQHKELTGTLEEQCEFLYELAQSKMADGNFTGAAHALQEIVKHAPEYRDAALLLAEAQQRKAEQRRLLLSGLLGAVIFIGIGTVLQLTNELLFLLLALVGALVGYVVATLLGARRPRAE